MGPVSGIDKVESRVVSCKRTCDCAVGGSGLAIVVIFGFHVQVGVKASLTYL